MRRRARGLTLVEIMVYSVLLGFLLTGVYGAFYISRLYWDSAQGTTEAQQECLRAMNAINRVLGGGNAGSLTVFSYGSPAHVATTGFTVLSARTSNGLFAHSSSGELLWQRWVVVYLQPMATSGSPPQRKRELRMREQIITPTASPPPAPAAPALINATVSGTNPPPVVLARSVGSRYDSPNPVPGLILVGGGGGGAGSLVGPYTVTTETQSPKFGLNRISVNSTVFLHH